MGQVRELVVRVVRFTGPLSGQVPLAGREVPVARVLDQLPIVVLVPNRALREHVNYRPQRPPREQGPSGLSVVILAPRLGCVCFSRRSPFRQPLRTVSCLVWGTITTRYLLDFSLRKQTTVTVLDHFAWLPFPVIRWISSSRYQMALRPARNSVVWSAE